MLDVRSRRRSSEFVHPEVQLGNSRQQSLARPSPYVYDSVHADNLEMESTDGTAVTRNAVKVVTSCTSGTKEAGHSDIPDIKTLYPMCILMYLGTS
jgi:hypothetical protein